MLHHVSYYFTSFNIVCMNDCVYESPTEKSPVYILMCAEFSWAILNIFWYCIILLLLDLEGIIKLVCIL